MTSGASSASSTSSSDMWYSFLLRTQDIWVNLPSPFPALSSVGHARLTTSGYVLLTLGGIRPAWKSKDFPLISRLIPITLVNCVCGKIVVIVVGG